MRILFHDKNDNIKFEKANTIAEASYISYNMIDGVLWFEDVSGYYIVNIEMDLQSANNYINQLYNTGMVDLSMYDAVVYNNDNEEATSYSCQSKNKNEDN